MSAVLVSSWPGAIRLGLLLVCLLPALAIAQPGPTSEPESAPRPAEEAILPIVAEARAALDKIDRLTTEYAELNARARSSKDDEDKAVAELQAQHRLFEWMRTIDGLVGNLLEQQEQGLDAAAFVQKTRKILWRVTRALPAFMDEITAKNVELRGALGEARPDEVTTVEARLRGTEESLDELVRFYLSLIQHQDALELGSTRARSGAAEKLEDRAGDLSARLELAQTRLDGARAVSGQAASPAEQASVRDAQENFDQIAASLWTVCDVMDELDLPSAKYRQTLILATGELTTDVLDVDIITGLADQAVEESRRWLERGGPVLVGRLAIFCAIFFLFWVLAGLLRRLIPRLVASSGEQVSELARRVIVDTTSRLVLAIGFFIALSQVGVHVTALLAGLGIVGFILGFALQETLGNFGAGAMILIYRPFDVGDVIEAAGVLGTVDHMNLVSTRILSFDNQTMIVPNSRIWGSVIRNATALAQRRVDLSFPLALDVDARAAEALFETMCREHPAVLDDPPPAIKVQEVSGAGVLFVVRPWVRTSDYWPTFWDLNREAYIRLAEAGIRVARLPYATESQDAPQAR